MNAQKTEFARAAKHMQEKYGENNQGAESRIRKVRKQYQAT
jgi:hypothetical protein